MHVCFYHHLASSNSIRRRPSPDTLHTMPVKVAIREAFENKAENNREGPQDKAEKISIVHVSITTTFIIKLAQSNLIIVF